MPAADSRALPALLAWLLSVWLGCGIAVALAAIAAFPSLAGRGVVVPGFESLAEHDPAASGRLAAGFVMDRIFAATDLAQWVLAPGATLAALVCWRRLVGGRGGRIAAAVALLSAIALVSTLVHSLSIGPTMEASLAEYRREILEGSLESALAVRQGFESTHAMADRVYGLRIAAVAVALPLALLLPGVPCRRFR